MHNDINAHLDRLRQLAEMEVRDWNPEPGDQVAGEVVELDTAESHFGNGDVPVVFLDGGDHLERVYCGRDVLRREVHKRDIRLGDVLAITYQGPRPSKQTGKEYHAYRVWHRAMQRTGPERAQALVEYDGDGREVPVEEDTF